jgi:hypothetical protein
MGILDDASVGEISRVLQLFPAAALRAEWGDETKRKKEVICSSAASDRDIPRITNFIQANFGRCRLHAYVLSPHPNGTSPELAITGAEVLQVIAGGPTLLMARVTYVVILQQSLQRETVNLLWPMRLEAAEGDVVLSMIVLERSPDAMYDEKISVVSRSLDEKTIIKNLGSLGFSASDLHKGVRALWDSDYMDAFKVKYRSPDSVVDETMDEELGIKACKPQRYEELKTTTLFMTFFHLLDQSELLIRDFMIDPSRGHLRFPRYTEDSGDADEVVRAILTENQ